MGKHISPEMRNRIAKLHAGNPTLSLKAMAQRMGVGTGTVSNIVRAAPAKKREAEWQEVLREIRKSCGDHKPAAKEE